MVVMLLSGAGIAADASAFTGTWVRDRARGESIGQAIENYVSIFDSTMKVRIRSRLGDVAQAAEQLTISIHDSGRALSIGQEGRAGTVASLDGKPVTTTGVSGETFEMRLGVEADRLVESYQAADGGRTNAYTVADKGKSLLVDVKIESPFMPKPLFYKLAYARK
jgi:hypothetical protein